MNEVAARAEVTPNRRGLKSRELVLDAAERVMAERGFEAATLALVVQEAGVPMSSVYHYFGSKEGILLAVMERGAERFFDDLPDLERRTGGAREHLANVISTAVRTLDRHPSFLRLLIALAVQPPPESDREVRVVIGRIRAEALDRLRRQLQIAFGKDRADPTIDELARFALAAIDGAFVASQADARVSLERLLTPLAPALATGRPSLRRAQTRDILSA
jgi:AcrR family transcriptional regulator